MIFYVFDVMIYLMIFSRLISMVKFSLFYYEMLLNMIIYIVDLNGIFGVGDLILVEFDIVVFKIVNEI